MSLLREIKFDFKSNVLYISSSIAIIFYFELKHEFFVTFILFDSVPKGGYKKRQFRQRRSDNQLTEFSRVNDSDPILGNTTILIVYMIWWKSLFSDSGNFSSYFRSVYYILIVVLRLSADPKELSGELSETNVCWVCV